MSESILTVNAWLALVKQLNDLVEAHGEREVKEALIDIIRRKSDQDPWHDQGNATNHRRSQCTEDCFR